MANPTAASVAEVPTNAPSVEDGPSLAQATGHAEPGPDSGELEVTRRLRAQYAEISQLAGGLAHEIRNPLSTLSLNLDLLAEDFQGAETARDRRVLQRIGRLKREAQRLYDILENFLRFARLQELRLVPTDLNAVVEEMCDFYEPQASTQGIVVRTLFAPTCPGCSWTPICSSRRSSTSCSTLSMPWRKGASSS